jgi:hypothetical protein
MKMKKQWTYQSIASAITKANGGNKRVDIGQVREFLKDLVDLSAEIKPRQSPLNFLRVKAYEKRQAKLKRMRK